jgi:glutamate-ammonia-ligase adenylyltransferase
MTLTPPDQADIDILNASRFLQRWLQGGSDRQTMLDEISRLSLTPAIFAQILQKEISSGATLNKAMRRLRNLVVCTLIKRDLCGDADMHEVVTTISEFADFVVQQHLAHSALKCRVYTARRPGKTAAACRK